MTQEINKKYEYMIDICILKNNFEKHSNLAI